MKTAFVHIGTHKTGSTYLQAWLIANQEKLLQEHNLLIPSLGPIGRQFNMLGKQHAKLATALKDVSLADGPGQPFDLLRSEISKSDHNILLSSELFENRIHTVEQIDFLVKFLAECGFRARIIVYIREQADYMNSRYAQDVRRFFYAGDFTSYAGRRAKVVWFDYGKLFRNILDRKDLDISVRPFPIACRTGLETDLMQVLTGNPALTRAELNSAGYQTTEHKNQACGPMTVLLARMAQKELKRRYPGKRRKGMMDFQPWMLVTRLGGEKGWDDTKFIGMYHELAARIRAQFRQQNEAFALKVWGCPWSERFPLSTFVSNELKPGDLSPGELNGLMAAVQQVVDLKARKEQAREKKEEPAPVRPTILKRIIRWVTRRCFPKPVAKKKPKNARKPDLQSTDS